MEKRLIIAIILSVVILVTYQLFFLKPSPTPKPAADSKPAAVSAPADAPAAGDPPAPPSMPEPTPHPEFSPPAPDENIARTQASPTKTRIETDLYKAALDNRGGIITSYVLKKYSSDDKNGVELIPSEKLPGGFGSFLSMSIPGNTRLEKEINTALFETRQSKVDTDRGPGERIEFHYQRSGLVVEKSFTFWEKEAYQLSTACTVTSGGRVLDGVYLRLGPGLTSHDLVPVKKNQIAPQAVMLMGDSVETFEAAKIHEMEANEKTKSGPWTWVGVQTRFFAALAIPGTPFGKVKFNSAPWKLREPEEKSDLPEKADIVSVWFPITGGQEVNLYLGPKSYEVLTAIREDLAKTIDYGWFAIIVRPLYYALHWINGYIGNWGWSIIALTFFITLALFPIRYMQMKNMRDMQKLQPQMKAIQSRYKSQKSAEDRQRMNQEMMQLYKEAGVNPMSGCLPMVAQIPFLIAFYNLIDKSIELWRQPFIFWIRDLSDYDPYFITPILMGLTMILQMQQTPPAPGQDSRMQKQMMYIMPVFLTFIFLWMSSGLVVYFLFSNVFSWGMQKAYELMFPNGRTPAAPAKKDKKKKTS